jgi:hypothetical protein
VPRRLIWQIDMGDGTWAVCCMACRLPLYRGPKLAAATASSPTTCVNPSSRSAAAGADAD